MILKNKSSNLIIISIVATIIITCGTGVVYADGTFPGNNIFGNTTDVSTEGTISTSPTQTLGRQSRMYVVSYKGSVFSPTNLRIHAGDTVRFYNDSFFPIHIVSDVNYTQEDFAGFDSVGDIPPGSSFSFTFTVKGTFGYNNGKNVNEAGTIIVR